jgi:two-component system NtrC family sensor kinase
MTEAELQRPRIRLWVKLAGLLAVILVAVHFSRLVVGKDVTTRALEEQQALFGGRIARLVAEGVTEPLLVGDLVTTHEVVSAAVDANQGIVYCFVVKDGRVLTTSFAGPTPEALVAARPKGNRDPIVVVREDGSQILEVVAPVLDGAAGEVRVGFSTEVLDRARRKLERRLQLLTAAMIVLGLGVAFVIGRLLARPVEEMLATVDSFDPAREGPVPRIVPRGSDEIAVLATRLNEMMLRLRDAHLEAEDARRKAFEADRLAALGTMTAGLAHEINNPLAGLENCVRRLERSDLPEPKRLEYVAHMRRSLSRIGSLVQRLLDFGRQQPMAIARVRLLDLAHDGVQLAMPLLREQRITCDVEEGDAAGGLVRADAQEISHALLNVLLNAAYVTPGDGRIRVQLRRRPGMLGIAVADEGPGIPQEIRDRVLDPFFTTKPVGGGTGLGLSVTRAILDAHGGELTFEFPEAKGTVVTLWLREAPQRRDTPVPVG